MDTRQRVIQRFKQRFGKPPEALAFAPGRVNLLGEHVDYNDGIVLPVAIDRLTTIAFSAAPDADSCLVALDFSEETSFSRLSRQEKCTTTGTPLPIWAHYPAGVAWAIDSAGLTAPALNAVFASDVPIAAGLSSSASVEMVPADAQGAACLYRSSPDPCPSIRTRCRGRWQRGERRWRPVLFLRSG